MALSDDLSRLAARTKEAEDRAAAAQGKAEADLEADLENARAVGEQQAEELRTKAEEGKGRISDRWADVQRAWNEAVAGVRADIQSKKGKLDLDMARRRAERAEDDARFAIDFAYSAVVEAEYAVLDAALARKEADAQSQEAGASA